MRIVSISNSKTRKGESKGYLTGIVHLAPARLSGYNVCPFASTGCKLACLNTSGNGNYPAVQKARIAKTRLLFTDRAAFLAMLIGEIASLRVIARARGLKVAVRLNGTSDVRWEVIAPQVFESYPDVAFYDYTKVPGRMYDYINGKLPANYHLTFSRSESNQGHTETIANMGGNVAVVFAKGQVPKTYLGRPVYDGDKTDLRFTDPKGVIIGLTAKGRAQTDKSGFVVRAA